MGANVPILRRKHASGWSLDRVRWAPRFDGAECEDDFPFQKGRQEDEHMKSENTAFLLNQEEPWYEDHSEEFNDVSTRVRESLIAAAQCSPPVQYRVVGRYQPSSKDP